MKARLPTAIVATSRTGLFALLVMLKMDNLPGTR